MIREAGVGFLFKSYFPEDKSFQGMDDASLGRMLLQNDPDLVDSVVSQAREDYQQNAVQGEGRIADFARLTGQLAGGARELSRGMEKSEGPFVPAFSQVLADVTNVPADLLASKLGQDVGAREAYKISAQDVYTPRELQERFGTPGQTAITAARSGAGVVKGIAEGLLLGPLLRPLAGGIASRLTMLPGGETLRNEAAKALVRGGTGYLSGLAGGTLDPESTPESRAAQAESTAALNVGLPLAGTIGANLFSRTAGIPRFAEMQRTIGTIASDAEQRAMESLRRRSPELAQRIEQSLGRIPVRSGGQQLRQQFTAQQQLLAEQRRQYYPETFSLRQKGASNLSLDEILNPNSAIYNAKGTTPYQMQRQINQIKKIQHPELGGQSLEEFLKGKQLKDVQIPSTVVDRLRGEVQGIFYNPNVDKTVKNAANNLQDNLYKYLVNNSTNPQEVVRLHQLASPQVSGAAYEASQGFGVGAPKLKGLNLTKPGTLLDLANFGPEAGMKAATLIDPESRFKVPFSRQILGTEKASQVSGGQVYGALSRILGSNTGLRLSDEREQRVQELKDMAGLF